MNVAELIEWLGTIPQDAAVSTLEHFNSGGYYQQGGTCNMVDFDAKVEYQQWKDEGDDTPVEYIYGEHFELSKNSAGEYTLQIGVKDK